MKPPFLKFEEQEQTGKTKIFKVYSTHSGDYLGLVHWRSGWRCYIMRYPSNQETDMSVSCNKELNDFMEKLENERKAML